MDFPSTVGAARICYAGQRFYMVKPLSLEGHAIILQWLDDVIPGREERKFPPDLGSDEAQAALQSPTGKALMIWLALRDHGIGENEAAEISDGLTDLERYVFIRALQTRRRTAPEATGEGKDIAQTWCSAGLAKLVREIGYRETLSLSMDQFEWLMKDGELEGEDPTYSTESLAEVQAEFQASLPELLERMKEQGVIT